MSDDEIRTPFGDAVLAHADEDEILALLDRKPLGELRRARATAHLARCRLCAMRLERRRDELAAGTYPDEIAAAGGNLWTEISAALKQLVEPIAVLVTKAGKLIGDLGPGALAPAWVGKTAGPADLRAEHREWRLEDPGVGAAIELSAESLKASRALVRLKLRLDAGGAPPLGGQVEIEQRDGRLKLVGGLDQFERHGADLPAGKYEVRVTATLRGGSRTWTLPLSVGESA